MAMQQCPNGHIYDDSKNSSCPFCSGGSGVSPTVPLSDNMPSMGGNAFPQTMPIDNMGGEYVPPQPNVAGSSDIPMTMPVAGEFGVTMVKEDLVNTHGIVEVRGWLVCLEGEKRGDSYTLRGEKNTVGRGGSNDIKLDFDNTISKGVNMTISYDVKNNKFYAYLGEATKNNIYVNDSLLMIPVELKDYDVIEIGVTKMLFRSLCNDQFTWEKSANKKAEE